MGELIEGIKKAEANQPMDMVSPREEKSSHSSDKNLRPERADSSSEDEIDFGDDFVQRMRSEVIPKTKVKIDMNNLFETQDPNSQQRNMKSRLQTKSEEKKPRA